MERDGKKRGESNAIRNKKKSTKDNTKKDNAKKQMVFSNQVKPTDNALCSTGDIPPLIRRKKKPVEREKLSKNDAENPTTSTSDITLTSQTTPPLSSAPVNIDISMPALNITENCSAPNNNDIQLEKTEKKLIASSKQSGRNNKPSNSFTSLASGQSKTPSKPKKKKRQVKDNERASKTQTTLTDHFQVRRSERRVKSITKNDVIEVVTKRILSQDEEGLEVRDVEEKGRGVFSTRPFLKGDLVCEYAGDLIDMEQAKERESDYEQQPEKGCYMYYFQYKNKKYCIDATDESERLGRLLNHSKVKNNVTTKLFPINNKPHLILVAARDIDPNEELLYDYGDRSKAAIESHPWLKL